jgi:hypothetical protein
MHKEYLDHSRHPVIHSLLDYPSNQIDKIIVRTPQVGICLPHLLQYQPKYLFSRSIIFSRFKINHSISFPAPQFSKTTSPSITYAYLMEKHLTHAGWIQLPDFVLLLLTLTISLHCFVVDLDHFSSLNSNQQLLLNSISNI